MSFPRYLHLDSQLRSAEVGEGRLISYLISPRVVGGSEDAVHIKRIERLRLWMFMLKISHWLIDCVWLEQSHRVVDRTLLFPGTQVHLGNSWGVTRENAVTEIESVNMSLCPPTRYLSYILVGLLKARGCIC